MMVEVGTQAQLGSRRVHWVRQRDQASIHLQPLVLFPWVALFSIFIGLGMAGTRTTKLQQYLPPNHCFPFLHQDPSDKVSFSVETLRQISQCMYTGTGRETGTSFLAGGGRGKLTALYFELGAQGKSYIPTMHTQVKEKTKQNKKQYFLSIVYAEFQLFCFYKNSIGLWLWSLKK